MMMVVVWIGLDSCRSRLVKDIQLVLISLMPFLVKNKKLFVYGMSDAMMTMVVMICVQTACSSCILQSLLLVVLKDGSRSILLERRMKPEAPYSMPFFFNPNSPYLSLIRHKTDMVYKPQLGGPPGGFGGSMI